MTKSNTWERARQGDVKAIAELINGSPQFNNITAQADLCADYLVILLESAQLPQQQALVDSIRQILTSLESKVINKIRIFGRQTGENLPGWKHEIEIALEVNEQNSTNKHLDFEEITEKERLAFCGTLYAMAATDGSIAPEELNLIHQFTNQYNLSKSLKKQLDSYKSKPPSLFSCLRELSNSDRLIKWSLMFYLVQITYADNVVDSNEAKAIELAQKEFNFRDQQVQAVQVYVETLKEIAEGKIDVNQIIKVTQKATANLETEGVPILELLASKQSNASNSNQNSYSENNFWKKLAEFAKTAGKEVVEKALILYYTLQQPNVPIKIKTIIYSALGYFILPLDLVPDFIPVVGFGDDISALLTALTFAAMYVTPEVKEAAKQKLQEWFN